MILQEWQIKMFQNFFRKFAWYLLLLFFGIFWGITIIAEKIKGKKIKGCELQ